MSVAVVAFAVQVPADTSPDDLHHIRDDLGAVLAREYAGQVVVLDSDAKYVPGLDWLAEPPIFRAAQAAWFTDVSE